jgi:hypothetical protein
MVGILVLASATWVKPDAVAKTIEDAIAAGAADAAAGDVRTLAWIDKPDDLHADFAGIRDALVNDGFQILEQAPDADPAYLSAEGADGSRAMVTLGAWNGQVYWVPVPATFDAPGKCVSIPDVTHATELHASGVDQQGEYSSNSVSWRLSTSRWLDVDGDGILDAFVPHYAKHQCPEVGSWDVYVVRGDCGHYVGRVGPGMPAIDASDAPLDASGLRPIAVESETSKLGDQGTPVDTTTRTTFTYRKKKHRYKKKAVKQSGGDCPHCATWYCS